MKSPFCKPNSRHKVALIGIEWDVMDLIESIPELEVVGFFDLNPQSELKGFLHLGNDDSWFEFRKKEPTVKIALALDFPNIRAHLFEHYGEESIITLISPHAYVSPRASIGHGSLIQRGVTVMPQAEIGTNCKINVNATVHHEAQIGNFCTLAPSSLVLGRVVIEDQVYVGAGAIIRQRCRIGKGATIGAGAVVVKDVPPGVTVVGVPAKTLQPKKN